MSYRFMTHQCCHGAALNTPKKACGKKVRKQESKEGAREGARKKDEEKGGERDER